MFSKQRIFWAKAPHAALLHTQKKINPQWQVPKCMRYRRERALLTGVGFSLRQVVFVHLVYFYQDCTMILGTCFNYFLATLRLQEQNNGFLDEMPFFHKVLMVV